MNCLSCWMKQRNCYGGTWIGDIKICDKNCKTCLIPCHETKDCEKLKRCGGMNLFMDTICSANCPNCEPMWNNFAKGPMHGAFFKCTKCGETRIRNKINEEFWKQYKR